MEKVAEWRISKLKQAFLPKEFQSALCNANGPTDALLQASI